jgi:hypothetical protein
MSFEPTKASFRENDGAKRLEPFTEVLARHLFCKAMEAHTPEVLHRLCDDVLPAYQAVTVEIAKRSYTKGRLRPIGDGGLDIDPAFTSELPVTWWAVERGALRTPEVAALCEAINKWSRQFNLGDEWLRDLALHTLYHWRQCVDSGKTIRLQWCRLPFGGMGVFDGRGEEFHFKHPGWNLHDEDWTEFKKGVRKAFETLLEEYRATVAGQARRGGWAEAPTIVDDRLRFQWLAWAKVRGWNAMRILEESNRIQTDISNVSKQVKLSAKQAGVVLRSLKGRPKKSESGRTRTS